MIRITSEFKPGDKLYTISQVPILKKCICDLCEGNGQIEHKGIPLLCPKCKGNDIEINTGYMCWEVVDEPLIVTSIRVKYHNPEKYFISYNVSGYKRSGDNLFPTKEAAIDKCNELNDALVSKNNQQSKNTLKIRYGFNINNKFNIGDSVYTIKKDFNSKKEDFFKPLEDMHTIDSIKLTIYSENSFDVRYKLDKITRQESRIFSSLEEAMLGCEELNKNEVVLSNA